MRPGVVEARFRQENGELLAADPRRNVAVTEVRTQDLGQRHEHAVAGDMQALFGVIDTRIWGTVLILVACVLTIWSMVYYLQRALPEIRAKAK